MSSNWAETIADEVSRLSDPAAVPSFTAMCKKQLAFPRKQERSEAEVQELEQTLVLVGSWLTGTAPIEEGFRALEVLAGYPGDLCPDCIPASVIYRFPSDDTLAPRFLELALQARRKSVVAAILESQRLPEDLLEQTVKHELSRFVSSRIPEALPDDSPCWAMTSLWDALAASLASQTDKTQIEAASKACVRCYAVSTDKKANERLWRSLAEASADVGPRLADQLLKYGPAATRCTSAIAVRLLEGKRIPANAPVHVAATLLGQRCAALIEQGLPQHAIPAGIFCALLAAAYSLPRGDGSRAYPQQCEKFNELGGPLPAIVRRLAGTAAGKTPVLATGDQISQCTPRPKSPADGEAAKDVLATASSRNPEVGVSDFLVDVAEALYSQDESIGVEQRLEVILFNRGVQPFGNVGEVVAYDAKRHFTTDPGVFPDDPMRVVRQGRKILIQGISRVLVKAQVTVE